MKFNIHKFNLFIFGILAAILFSYAFRHEAYNYVADAVLCVGIAFYASLGNKNDWRFKL